MRYLIGIIFLMLSFAGFGTTVYSTTDENKNTVYSDSPSDNSQKIQIPDSNSTKKTTVTTETKTAPEEIKKPYLTFSLESPKDQETFQNQRSIPIELKIDPNLQQGDLIQVYVDGIAIGKPVQTTKFEIEMPERGSHQLYVELQDANSCAIRKSNAVTIFVHLANLINKPKANN